MRRLYIAIAAVLPAAVLLWTSLFGYALPVARRRRFQLGAYRALFANRAFWLGLRNTLLVALVSALIVTAIGAVLGWIISRSRLKIRHALDFVSRAFGRHSGRDRRARRDAPLPVAADRSLRHVWILVVAYSYRFATTTRLARAGFLQIHRELEEASATSGARWLATQRRISCR